VLAYPADGTQDDLRLPDERQDVKRPAGRLAGTVSTAVHLAAVGGPTLSLCDASNCWLIENSTTRSQSPVVAAPIDVVCEERLGVAPSTAHCVGHS